MSIRAIDSNTEEVSWSGVFDNGVDQFIDLQNQIATELAKELKGSLAATETQQLAQKATGCPRHRSNTSPAAASGTSAARRFENALKHFGEYHRLDPDYADPPPASPTLTR